MIRVINISVGHKAMNVHTFTEKLVVNPEKKQLAIVGKTKAITCLFKSIMQLISQ